MIKIISKDIRGFDREAGKCVAREIRSKDSDLLLALPTGKTPLGMYRELVKQKLDWSQVRIFMLDVNYPQDSADPNSFYSFAQKYLPTKKFNILNSQAQDPEEECRAYEAKIKAAGGIDLAVLGIGSNGHIAYNEPGTGFDSLTHLAKLKNQKFKFGLTMGIKTIMAAKKIILLAKGKGKAAIVKRAIEGQVDPSCPASVLQKHQDATWLLDPAAGSLLK